MKQGYSYILGLLLVPVEVFCCVEGILTPFHFLQTENPFLFLQIKISQDSDNSHNSFSLVLLIFQQNFHSLQLEARENIENSFEKSLSGSFIDS